MTVEQQSCVGGAERVLHHNHSDIAHVNVDVVAAVESSRVRRCGGCRGCHRQREELVVSVLKESLSVGEEEIASVHVFLHGLERGDRPRHGALLILRLGGAGARAKMKESSEHIRSRKSEGRALHGLLGLPPTAAAVARSEAAAANRG
jgi:hypothetical protein